MPSANQARLPQVDRETIDKVCEYLEQGKTSFDLELFETFEADLCRYFGVPHALLTCNGTSAAFSSFFALGLEAGDEIIAPPYTHWATVIPATLLGCRVVFADLEADSLSLDVQAAKARITAATRAIVVCHLYGNPVNLGGFRELCDREGLYLVEDISHAPGATVNGEKVGSFGDIAFISFHSKKLISGGEGGALLTKHFDFYVRAVELGHPKRIFRLPPEYQTYNKVGLGYKFRLSPLLALLAYESFKRLDQRNALRREICEALRESLADIREIRTPSEIPGASRVYLNCEFLVSQGPDGWAGKGPGSVTDILERLKASQVPVRPANFEFLPNLPHFRNAPAQAGSLPNARRLVKELMLLDPPAVGSAETLEGYSRAFHHVFEMTRSKNGR
jgi:dTDP-4-amino-4,6-dideoxygalactose transaminase